MVGEMAHWRWIACLRLRTLDDRKILTGVRPPPRERDRSIIRVSLGDSGGGWWMKWSIGGCESSYKRETCQECKQENGIRTNQSLQ